MASARCVRPILMIVVPLPRPCRPARRCNRSSAGISCSLIATATATWMAVGNMSLVLCPMLTWSLGWIGFSAPKRSPPDQLDRPVGDHLVGVHVARGAGAGLKDVDRETGRRTCRRPPRGRRPAGRRPAGRSSGLLPRAGQLAQVAVDAGGGPLDQAQGVDQLGGSGQPEMGKFSTARCVCAVVGLGGHADLAHRVAFDAEFAHRGASGVSRKGISEGYAAARQASAGGRVNRRRFTINDSGKSPFHKGRRAAKKAAFQRKTAAPRPGAAPAEGSRRAALHALDDRRDAARIRRRLLPAHSPRPHS